MEIHKQATPQLNICENIADRSTITMSFMSTIISPSPREEDKGEGISSY
jgi:hypothetical protein